MSIISKIVVGLIAGSATCLAVFAAWADSQRPSSAADAARYDAAGRLLFPSDYRDWVFLIWGLNMRYSDAPSAFGMNIFGNIFAPRAAYAAFLKTARWPDRTVLLIENRMAATKGSINERGQFQTLGTMGFEAHVKNLTWFKGGWE